MRERNVCVYCGSGTGRDARHGAAADELGRVLAEAGIGLVYGGGGNGLMGRVAAACEQAGGRIIGIIPEGLVSREAPPASAARELIIVPTLHARKMAMFERSDAFVALPGGLGTLEELVEQLTWVQIGLHAKPVVIADIGGYWEPLFALLERMRAQSYIRPGLVPAYEVVREADVIIPALTRLWRGPDIKAPRQRRAAATRP